MTDAGKFIDEPARQTPVIDTVDVLVAGGGPAGIAAALASAREGARTLLVERYGYVGGMITGAHVVAVLGAGDGEQGVIRGISLEIQERLEELGAAKPLRCGDYRVDAEVFKWQAVEMLQEAGSGILMHSLACAPVLEDACVAGAFIESKSGRQAIRAAVTIDCTADGDLAFQAGCACDDETHDVTLGVVVQGVDREKADAFRESSPEDYEALVQENARLHNGAILGGKYLLKDIDISDAAALTEAEIAARRDYFGALGYLRERLPGYENARIAQTRPQLGVRQGRRVRGEYVLVEDDLRAGRHFDDGIGRMGTYMTEYANIYAIHGLDYDVPYRCLVPESMDGLLVAGRCVSCDYMACNSLRLIAPCFATGQAAGAAAAIAAADACAPRDVSIQRLRALLAGQGAYLG